jgi:hypothetical protein
MNAVRKAKRRRHAKARKKIQEALAPAADAPAKPARRPAASR